MTTAPTIPFGYRLVQGPAQKGDGVWDGTRFRKARKVYPSTEPAIIIRKCEVVQEVMAVTEPTITLCDGNGNNPRQLTRSDYEGLKKCGMLGELYPGAPERWPEPTTTDDMEFVEG